MFFLLRSLFIALLGLLLALALIVTQLLDTSSTVPLQWQADPHLAREIFNKASEQIKTKQDLSLDEREINHLANSLLNRYLKSSVAIRLQDDNHSTVAATMQLPEKLYGAYLTGHFELHNEAKGLAISQLHIGRLAIPATITNRVVNHLLHHSFLRHYYRLGVQHIQAIQIKNHQLIASYALNSNATGLANSVTLDPALLAFYQQQVELLAAKHNPNWRLSLADLLCPLFKLAYKRASKNAIMENIAIIYAVSAYVNSNETPFYLTLKRPESTVRPYPVFLYKRTDQAKHFMLSAVLATTGSTQLADIMGQEKELRDAQLSSGFSFVDLAADRAGMRFSEQAIRSPEHAKNFQRVMADTKDYTAFMPETRDLPEKLTHAQFAQRFDAIGSKSYKALLQQIDGRINALPLYAKQ